MQTPFALYDALTSLEVPHEKVRVVVQSTERDMARAVAEIERDIRALTDHDRSQLIRSIISTMDGPDELDVDAEWLKESNRRLAEIDSGAAKTYPMKDVFKQARSRLK